MVHRIDAVTAGRCLGELGYSLQANVLPGSPLWVHSLTNLVICFPRISDCFALLILTSLESAKMTPGVTMFLERSSSNAYRETALLP